MSDFNTQMKQRAELVEQSLDRTATVKENYHKRLYEAMRYSLLGGGKRLRGILVLSGYAMAGGEIEKALAFASASEMIHAYSLVHDDLPAMDNDEMRRGKPTCHIAYGEDMAILAGDALLNFAFETMLADMHNPPMQKVNAMQALAIAAGCEGMVAGQVVDLYAEGKQIPAEMMRYIHARKTGALICGSLNAGLLLGGGDALIQKTTAYAEKIGMAFQIQDDILDVESSLAVLGKPVGSDAKNEKSTYVTLYGMECAKQMVVDLTKQAMELTNDFGSEQEFLKELALYLADRKV